MPRGLLIRDRELRDSLIEERKKTGTNLYDEVWEGMYVMPSMPNLERQKMVRRLSTSLAEVLEPHGLGEVYPGANVSDRRTNWKENYRVPDVIAALKNGRAVACGTHL